MYISKKTIISVLSSISLLAGFNTANAAIGDTAYYQQAYDYASGLGEAGGVNAGAPSKYPLNENKSTAVVSAYSVYYPQTGYGYERARIWSRPNIVKAMINSTYTVDVATLKAVLQFQSTGLDPRFAIDFSEPSQSSASNANITIPDYVFDLIGVKNPVTGIALSTFKNYINGFTTSAVKVVWPLPNQARQQSYIEYFKSNGLDKMALSDSYTYREADIASKDINIGASAKWKYSLVGRDTNGNAINTNYPVEIQGRIMYRAMNVVLSEYFYTYYWTDLSIASHTVNKPS